MIRSGKKIAVLIPCFNESLTIEKVVADFRRELPEADIYVYDNNSTDDTAERARQAGAIVRFEPQKGKGNVIRSMLADITADVYVMVDGDDTYPAGKVHDLIQPVAENQADMVVGSRLHQGSESKFKIVNRFGNLFFRALLNSIFNVQLTDILSGMRAFNRSIADLPLVSSGFDLETEMTIKSVSHKYKIKEIPINLSNRPEGSKSKIKIGQDGTLILKTIFSIMRDYKPMLTFGFFGLGLVLLGFIPGMIVIVEFVETGLIERIPSAILAVGFVLSGVTVIFAGMVLHSISRRFSELNMQMRNVLKKLEKLQRKPEE